MATQVENSITRLVNANGNFREGIQEYLELDVEDSPLAVVSIIGAQSSGKSTLLNLMFDTEFREMDAESGRQRTTKGIWVAKYSSKRGCILVIDTEGSDGTEREGNETFARQTAVFAMAISHVVIINMMCTDIGRESGGGWPLLRTACEVMLRKFSTPHQVTLLFVLRDKTDSPLEALESQIMDEMEKILNKMTRRQSQANACLSRLFKIEVMVTSHYLVKSERLNFKAEVKELRKWIIYYTTSNKSASKRIPTSSFTTYAKKIWDEIKENKDLDLPSYRIMAAKEHCNRIAKYQSDSFGKDKSWRQIKKEVKSGSIIQGFGKKVSSLMRAYRSEYNEFVIIDDETTRDECGKRLITELLQIVEPTYLRLVGSMRSEKLDDFKMAALAELKKKGKLKAVEVQDFITEFDDLLKDARIKKANWTHESTQLDTLRHEIDLFIAGINATNTELDKQKKDKRKMWSEIAFGISIAASMAFVVVGCALAPPLAAAGVPSMIIPLVIKMVEHYSISGSKSK